MRLTDAQRRIVDYEGDALLVLAGPGAGKTRVVVERIRRILSEESGHFRVLALTFTNKAANEMRERLDVVAELESRAFIGTIHSFCMEVLESRGKMIGLPRDLHIVERYADRKEMLRQAATSEPALAAALRDAGDVRRQDQRLGRWLERISEIKAALQVPESLHDERERALYLAYEAEMRNSSSIDFDDILALAYRIFEEHPRVARFYRKQFRYIFVDEAQDLNEAQYRLICALCGNEHRKVMLVGDPRQAIYVWKGADPKYLDLFVRDFAAERLVLSENFRSSQAVVRAAQTLNPSYLLDAQLPIDGEVSTLQCEDEDAEADGVCDAISQLLANGHPSIEGRIEFESIAVLGRNRYVLSALEERFKEKGWPYHKRLAAGSYQAESDLVREFEFAVRVLANPHDRLYIGKLAASWRVGGSPSDIRDRLSSKDQTPLEFLGELARSASSDTAEVVLAASEEVSRNGSMTSALDHLEHHLDTMGEEPRALGLEDIKAWRSNWDRFARAQSGGDLSLGLFLSQVALGATDQPRGDGTAFLTVHSAKGMEFDIVVVMGMCEGVFPDYRARDEAMEEEDRNAFVAITRAKRVLYLTYPRIRMMPWGDPKVHRPSRYWLAIEQALGSD